MARWRISTRANSIPSASGRSTTAKCSSTPSAKCEWVTVLSSTGRHSLEWRLLKLMRKWDFVWKRTALLWDVLRFRVWWWWSSARTSVEMTSWNTGNTGTPDSTQPSKDASTSVRPRGHNNTQRATRSDVGAASKDKNKASLITLQTHLPNLPPRTKSYTQTWVGPHCSPTQRPVALVFMWHFACCLAMKLGLLVLRIYTNQKAS